MKAAKSRALKLGGADRRKLCGVPAPDFSGWKNPGAEDWLLW